MLCVWFLQTTMTSMTSYWYKMHATRTTRYASKTASQARMRLTIHQHLNANVYKSLNLIVTQICNWYKLYWYSIGQFELYYMCENHDFRISNDVWQRETSSSSLSLRETKSYPLHSAYIHASFVSMYTQMFVYIDCAR